jgi:hypothetical protein
MGRFDISLRYAKAKRAHPAKKDHLHDSEGSLCSDFLGHIADAKCRRRRGLASIQENIPSMRHETRDCTNKGRLAGALWADPRQHAPGFGAEI